MYQEVSRTSPHHRRRYYFLSFTCPMNDVFCRRSQWGSTCSCFIVSERFLSNHRSRQWDGQSCDDHRRFSLSKGRGSSTLSPEWRRIFLSSQRNLPIRCRWSTVFCSRKNNCLYSSKCQWQTHTRADLVHAFRPRRIPRESQCAERQSSDEFHRAGHLTSSIRSSEPSWSHLARHRLWSEQWRCFSFVLSTFFLSCLFL